MAGMAGRKVQEAHSRHGEGQGRRGRHGAGTGRSSAPKSFLPPSSGSLLPPPPPPSSFHMAQHTTQAWLGMGRSLEFCLLLCPSSFLPGKRKVYI